MLEIVLGLQAVCPSRATRVFLDGLPDGFQQGGRLSCVVFCGRRAGVGCCFHYKHLNSEIETVVRAHRQLKLFRKSFHYKHLNSEIETTESTASARNP